MSGIVLNAASVYRGIGTGLETHRSQCSTRTRPLVVFYCDLAVSSEVTLLCQEKRAVHFQSRHLQEPHPQEAFKYPELHPGREMIQCAPTGLVRHQNSTDDYSIPSGWD